MQQIRNLFLTPPKATIKQFITITLHTLWLGGSFFCASSKWCDVPVFVHQKSRKKDRCWLYHKITIDDVMIIVYGQQQRNRTENMTRRKMLSNSSTSSSIEIICWGVLLLMLLLLNCLCCSLLHAWLVGAHSTTTCDDDLISLHDGFLFVPFEIFMRVNHFCI